MYIFAAMVKKNLPYKEEYKNLIKKKKIPPQV